MKSWSNNGYSVEEYSCETPIDGLREFDLREGGDVFYSTGECTVENNLVINKK